MSQGHPHAFSDAEWPFAEATNVAVFSTRRVADGHPILFVTHDAEDGAWQILCGTPNRSSDALVRCLGCLFEQDPTIGELADLPPGWCAFRASAKSPWYRRPSDPEQLQ
jgi:hypothetical protein